MNNTPDELDAPDTVEQQPPRGRGSRPPLKGRLSVKSLNFGIPANEGAQEHVEEEHGKDSWRYKVLSFLHSRKVQIALAVLLVLDVTILFAEIFLLAAYPPCGTIKRDSISCCPAEIERFLAETHEDHICEEGSPNELEVGCDEHKHSTVHKAEEVLFVFTMIILCTFMVEQNLAMIALRPCIYFRQLFYALDYFIISASIAFEVTFHVLHEDELQALLGLLIVGRLWRFVRIGHGIVEVTAELAHDRYETLLAYTEDLEELLVENGIDLPETESVRKLRVSTDSITAEIKKAHRHKHHSRDHSSSSDQPTRSEGASSRENTSRRVEFESE